MPGVTPVTMPPTTVAFPLLVVHAPPLTVDVSVLDAKTHTVDGPLIVPALGSGLTVKGLVAVAVPQPLVTA